MENSGYTQRTNVTTQLKRLSWGAVFAGVIVTIVVQLLLTLLGLGIGFVSFNPTNEGNSFSGMGTGAMVWWCITVVISLYLGGWVSGWLSTTDEKIDRMLHGVLTWGLFALLSFYLVTTSVGYILGGIGGLIGKGIAGTGSVIAKSVPDVSGIIGQELNINSADLNKLKDEALLLLRQTEKSSLQPGNLESKAKSIGEEAKQEGKEVAEDPAKADEASTAIINKLFSLKDDVISDLDKDALTNVVANRTGKTKAESRTIVNNWVETAETTKQNIKQATETAKENLSQVAEDAKEVSEEVTNKVGGAAIFSFFALLIGAASAIGGSITGKNRVTVLTKY